MRLTRAFACRAKAGPHFQHLAGALCRHPEGFRALASGSCESYVCTRTLSTPDSFMHYAPPPPRMPAVSGCAWTQEHSLKCLFPDSPSSPGSGMGSHHLVSSPSVHISPIDIRTENACAAAASRVGVLWLYTSLFFHSCRVCGRLLIGPITVGRGGWRVLHEGLELISFLPSSRPLSGPVSIAKTPPPPFPFIWPAYPLLHMQYWRPEPVLGR